MQICLKNRSEETVRIYFEKTQDFEIKAMLPQKAKTVEEALQDYEKSLKSDSTSYGKIIVVDGQYIGDIWCYGINQKEDPNAMLSFCLFEKSFWSKGLMSEAVELFLKEIQLKFGLKTIGAFVFLENQASIRVLKKNGFQVMEEFVEEGKSSVYLQYTYSVST